jgi:hypothetical protein
MIYNAFISYSHSANNKLARALQRSLQSFAKPWYRRSKISVFLDRTDLAASPGLWPSIERSLEQSDFFILLASPESAASPWVNREVGFWLESCSPDTLLIALTHGQMVWDGVAGGFNWDKTNALPETLRCRFSAEPQWVDLRELEERQNHCRVGW